MCFFSLLSSIPVYRHTTICPSSQLLDILDASRLEQSWIKWLWITVCKFYSSSGELSGSTFAESHGKILLSFAKSRDHRVPKYLHHPGRLPAVDERPLLVPVLTALGAPVPWVSAILIGAGWCPIDILPYSSLMTHNSEHLFFVCLPPFPGETTFQEFLQIPETADGTKS